MDAIRKALVALAPVCVCTGAAMAWPPVYGAMEYIECSGADIDIGGYSDPFVADWDGDGLRDLIVGQYYSPGYTDYGKIRWYPNEGTNPSPVFSTYDYIQADGTDIVCNYG
ncbi:hypothetical protein JW921_02265 [Candidatus Fermentibacterales bacterium]|nr:hypothetical protein [Candidatus Fermentibacterales bacterium]